MRQRRHRLQVSTFPFLAVLLCAMGSLILLLLVLDRRARVVARARSLQTAGLVAAQAEQAAAAHRAEWERRRQLLHQQIASEDQEVRVQIGAVDRQLQGAIQSLQQQQARHGQAQDVLEKERARLADWAKQLSTRRAELAQTEEKAEASLTERQRLSAELELMERTLDELKALRLRQLQTRSIVPYRGKQGDGRKPLYVECAVDGLVFYPEHTAVRLSRIRPDEVRNEIDRRLARRASESGTSPGNPYILLLVRPDGITAYYRTLEVLKALQVEFGYEFIERDWVLDFPEDDNSAAQQPWMVTQKAEVLPSNGPAIRKVKGLPAPRSQEPLAQHRGVVFGGDGPALGGGGSSLGTRQAGRSASSTAGSGPQFGPFVSASGSGSPTSGQTGSASDREPGPIPLPSSNGSWTSREGQGPGGSLPIAPGTSAPTATGPKSGREAGASGASPSLLGRAGSSTTSADVARMEVGGASAPFSQRTGPPQSGSGTVPFSQKSGALPSGGAGSPGGAGEKELSTGDRVGLGTPTPGSAEAAGSGRSSGQASSDSPSLLQRPDGGAQAQGGATPANAEIGSSRPGGGTARNGSAGADPTILPSTVPTSGTGGGQSGSSGEAGVPGTPGEGSGRQAGGGEANGSGPPAGSTGDPIANLGPRAPDKKEPRSVTFRPMLLHGNRDWIIPVECTGDELVLSSTAQRFPLSAVSRGDNAPGALAAAVRRLIDGRQATVRPGDPPYRPMIRFRVRPEGLRAYYLAYPALEALQVPMTRENLEREDPKGQDAGH
jgi:hypothetical protein